MVLNKKYSVPDPFVVRLKPKWSKLGYLCNGHDQNIQDFGFWPIKAKLIKEGYINNDHEQKYSLPCTQQPWVVTGVLLAKEVRVNNDPKNTQRNTAWQVTMMPTERTDVRWGLCFLLKLLINRAVRLQRPEWIPEALPAHPGAEVHCQGLLKAGRKFWIERERD